MESYLSRLWSALASWLKQQWRDLPLRSKLALLREYRRLRRKLERYHRRRRKKSTVRVWRSILVQRKAKRGNADLEQPAIGAAYGTEIAWGSPVSPVKVFAANFGAVGCGGSLALRSAPCDWSGGSLGDAVEGGAAEMDRRKTAPRWRVRAGLRLIRRRSDLTPDQKAAIGLALRDDDVLDSLTEALVEETNIPVVADESHLKKLDGGFIQWFRDHWMQILKFLLMIAPLFIEPKPESE